MVFIHLLQQSEHKLLAGKELDGFEKDGGTDGTLEVHSSEVCARRKDVIPKIERFDACG